MGLIPEIIIILLLILVNGILSMTETAFVSARKTRLQEQAENGDARSRDALTLANNPNQILGTLELGMALIDTLTGVFSGAMIAQWIAQSLRLIPWLAPYSDAISLFLVVIIITYLSLVIGELVPKRLALGNPERVAAALVRPIRMLSMLAAPVVSLLSFSTEGVLRLIGWRPSSEPPVSEEEIRILIKQGTQLGVFEEEEQELIERIFPLRDRQVSALMTRRPDIIWLDIEKSRDALLEIIRSSNHSHFPVCRGNLDTVLGIVRVKDLFLQQLSHQTEDIQEILREPIYVFERTSTLKVLEMFRETGTTLALVVQEDGEIQGLITVYDILHEIVGDVAFADDVDGLRKAQRAGEAWSFDGAFPVDKVKDILHLQSLPNEKQGGYVTVGGMILMTLGHIPQVGDILEWSGYRFEVKQMAGRRVRLVTVVANEHVLSPAFTQAKKTTAL